MRPPIEAVLVVVPARDEQLLLPACLDAVAVAAAAVSVPVSTVVVLDACVDGTAAVLAGRAGVRGVVSDAGCVGAARRTGVRQGLLHLPDVRAARIWVGCTDADSRVPPSWLSHHLELADDGADLVLGTVDLPDSGAGAGHGPRTTVAASWRRAYEREIGPVGVHPHVHPHVHGANLGVRASAYQRAGGFAPVRVHEDVLLARTLAAQPGCRVVSTVGSPVVTSDRLVARAPDGLAGDLRELGEPADPLWTTA